MAQRMYDELPHSIIEHIWSFLPDEGESWAYRYIDNEPIGCDYECNNSQSNAVYQEGDQLRCLDVEQNLDLCFPDDCDVPFDLSRLFGKVTWIELTASW